MVLKDSYGFEDILLRPHICGLFKRFNVIDKSPKQNSSTLKKVYISPETISPLPLRSTINFNRFDSYSKVNCSSHYINVLIDNHSIYYKFVNIL